MYKNLKEALLDLEKAGMLKRIKQEVDPNLEMAEIARQAYDCSGPAILFEKIKGCEFQAAANIFGTSERIDFLFRKTLKQTQSAIEFKSNPIKFFSHINPFKWLSTAIIGLKALPKKSGSISDFEECSLSSLPQIKSWSEDGGAFITLPIVATRPCEKGGILQTNLGMYRIQISGNEYNSNECGLHYQINRDIASHHQKALLENRPLKVSIFIGGPPAHTIASIMPMPENLSEIIFAGMLSGRRFRYFTYNDYLISSDAEFCILGELSNDLKLEGPFGDHIGYYSSKHKFPYLKVEKVLCKKNAIYPFTVVGRPPKEDTQFGNFIHKITKPMVPISIPHVHSVHAVDEAGVHALCLAIGNEKYLPYLKDNEREPMELLKIANALLGFNQISLSKYLLLVDKEDNRELDVNNIPDFFKHLLERIVFSRDIHLQTETTIDTLDYSGTSLNHGSKAILVACGNKKRVLRHSLNDLESLKLPNNFHSPKIIMNGVIVIEFDKEYLSKSLDLDKLKDSLKEWTYRKNYPWITIIDSNQKFNTKTKQGLNDFLWMTFTRSNPACDLYGINETFKNKHWSIEEPLIVDATIKPHHQKELIIDSSIKEKAKKILTHLILILTLLFPNFSQGEISDNLSIKENHCGTLHSLKTMRNKNYQKIYLSANNCNDEDYYDSIFTRKTKHFEIFYTLEGVHATTTTFVDSTAFYLEKAWDLHVNKMGMRFPISDSITFHYQKKVQNGLYAIEIIDIHKVRNRSFILGADGCGSGCFGITIPSISDPHKTEIILENDFLYTPTYNANTNSIKIHDKTCTYKVSSKPILSNYPYVTDYSKDYSKAIKITAFHELYHAIQLRYINFQNFNSFWLEASATGVEEIGAPEINDYLNYLKIFFNSTGISIDNLISDYGTSVFYLYLYNHFKHDFDKSIWEGFSKNQNIDFKNLLTSILAKNNLSADSIFHDFSVRLSFSGSRSEKISQAFWINKDQNIWPEIVRNSTISNEANIPEFSYKYYSGINIDLKDFIGHVSAIQYKNNKANISYVSSTNSLDSIILKATTYDSILWVLSRFTESDYIKEIIKDSTLKAFPTPWRKGNLCFSPLPKNKKFIEIRTRSGNLVMREPYTHSTHCIDESIIKNKMAPGVYKFRAGSKGKTSSFIIIY